MEIGKVVTQPKTDVLVIGGGLAGMYAAIEASGAGKQVTILSKGKVGASGSSLVSMSVHRFAPEEEGLREDYRRRFLDSGGGIQNPRVAEILVSEGARAVEDLRRFDLPLEYRSLDTEQGSFDYLACCSPKKGRNLTLPLRVYIQTKTSVTLKEGVMAFDLITADGQIAGVLAESAGTVLYYPADAVVLATGGGGNVYRYTSNTSDLTGDGYAMALRCGLPLVDMEFVQFYPYRIVSPQVANIFPDIFEHGAVYRNERGERFMEAFPKKELENRDVLAREVYRQGKVVLDLSGCERNYMERECPDLVAMERRFPARDLEIRPVAHFFMGGIPLAPDCATAVGGLFVCGEVTGGLHGANRLSGSALTEAAVFGRRAGRGAASWKPAPRDAAAEKTSLGGKLAAVSEPGTQSVAQMRRDLRDRMWAYASVERNPENLRRLLRFLEDLEKELSGVRPGSLRQMLELRDMLAASRSVAEAALRRKESLGAHYICGEDRKNGVTKS